jgi:hypothetical protein
MIPYFQRLGERIEQEWLERSYDEEDFPQLVLDALRRDPPFGQVEVTDIVDWVFGSSYSFPQPSHGAFFGEPPVSLFHAPRFYIEALFWRSGTTSIHEHSFSGAFAVLAGASVHSHWRFALDRTVNSRMLCGRLERVTTEFLRVGDMRPIHAGGQLIHQLFHLDVPSVTIVVRTYADRNHLPQYNYHPPGLAIDDDSQDPLRVRRMTFLDAMARGEIGGLAEHAGRLIRGGDLETVYQTFAALNQHPVDPEWLKELYRAGREQHGDIVDLFRRVCEEERRRRRVTGLRGQVVDPGSRFFLALLMLMPDRDAVFDAIRRQFPGVEPLPTIETWVEGMAKTIGLNFTGVNRTIFRGLIEGLDVYDLLQSLGSELEDDDVLTNPDWLLDRARQMARSDLFYPLFSTSPLQALVREAAG